MKRMPMVLVMIMLLLLSACGETPASVNKMIVEPTDSIAAVDLAGVESTDTAADIEAQKQAKYEAKKTEITDLFNSGAFQNALELMDGMELDEELSRIYNESQANLCYEDGNYSKVINLLSSFEEKESIEIYADACRKTFEEAIKKSREEYDSEQAVSAIDLYYTQMNDYVVVNNTLYEVFNGIVSGTDYWAFLYADSVVEKCESYSFASDLASILVNAENQRARAFLCGTWVRQDGTTNSGLQLEVKATDDSLVGILTYAPKGLAFKEKDIKWKDIQIFDSETIILQDLASNGDSYYYSDSSMSLDYDSFSLSVHATLSGERYSYGKNQVWIRSNAVNYYAEIESIHDDDFAAEIWDSDTQSFVPEDYLDEVLDDYIYWYCYDEEVDKAKDRVITTNRGIMIGSSKAEVLERYGIGIVKAIDIETDNIYDCMNETEQYYFSSLYATQQEYQVIYQHPLKNASLIFGFDKNDEVSWIIYTSTDGYWYEEE